MKSSSNDLRNRGYVEDKDLIEYLKFNKQELLDLLDDEQPFRRTIGAQLLKKFPQPEIIEFLCKVLKKEKKLYTKIALTETLASFGDISLLYLIPLLGKIGNNQYRAVPEKGFKKINYPLPRDIIARTIIKIGDDALPALEKIALIGERNQILETIDAIGYISFYSLKMRSLPILWKVLEKNPQDNLLIWKVVRALESFPDAKVESYLKNILKQNVLPGIKIEARRSLTQINKLKNRME